MGNISHPKKIEKPAKIIKTSTKRPVIITKLLIIAPKIRKIKFEEKVTQTPVTQKGKTPTSLEEIQQELGKMISEQLKGILPVDTLPKILNLAIWSMLAWILIFGGAQIASLGIKLIKQ